MPYIVDVAFTDSYDERMKIRPAHVDYLNANLPHLLAAGAKMPDDGDRPHGGLYILTCDTRKEAEAFVANEPYFKAGFCKSVTYTRWRKGVFNHERL